MADKTTAEIFKDRLDEEKKLNVNTFKSVFISDVLHAKTAKDLPYIYQQAPICSIIASQGNDVIINGNFWGVVPYEGKYDALGLATLGYDKQHKDFKIPEYWVNTAFNFQEITFVQQVKQQHGNSYLMVTYDGKLLITK